MASNEVKKQFNIKLPSETVDLIEKAAYVLQKPKGLVVQEAVDEYARAHNLHERYQLHITNGMLVLLKMEAEKVQIVGMEQVSGMSPESVAERYSEHLGKPVKVVK